MSGFLEQDFTDQKGRRGGRGAVDSLAAEMSSLCEVVDASPSKNEEEVTLAVGRERMDLDLFCRHGPVESRSQRYGSGEHIATPCDP
jgi:hypothetical protein